MTENKDKLTAGAGGGSSGAEIASSNNNNAQGQSTIVAGGSVGSTSGKTKDKKNDNETSVGAMADTQHEREKDKEPHDRIRRLTRLLHITTAITTKTTKTINEQAVETTIASVVSGGDSGDGGGGVEERNKSEATLGNSMMSKMNARNWLHPTATTTHSDAHTTCVTPPATTPLAATTPFMLTTVTTTTNTSAMTAASNTLAATTCCSTPTSTHYQLQQQVQQQQQQLLNNEELRRNTFYRTVCASFQSAILLLDMDTGEFSDYNERCTQKDEFGTQRVYKKTSPNCVLTLYLPSREITLSGNNPAILRGIIYVDPKAIQGYRVYAQLTLTFRYGREDEEVMGLRFCNEAIMSLHQVWPRNEEPSRESLSPLQEALMKRLGDGAHPFTLTLTPQAPPSVQLVPAKRYYGAPIGTSYDVRCFIADKTDEKFLRRASVKMGVRVIYRTDVYNHANGPENFAALINNQGASPPLTASLTSPPPTNGNSNHGSVLTHGGSGGLDGGGGGGASGTTDRIQPAHASSHAKPRKSERGDSFPKLRLSPKSFRFSGRFGRSKSEIEKCPTDPFYSYSKSFQEYDSTGAPSAPPLTGTPASSGVGGGGVGGVGCAFGGVIGGNAAATIAGALTGGGGPQGAVDKPFLLQDGRVGLRASLDKAWYTHGEDVCVTVHIKNDSRKTVRKVRVCAIQHVDVCMFNNGKFKNIVADSDTSSPVDRTVPPGSTLNTTIVLKPARGQTKNWIALEDTLQRSTEPDEINGVIAASAIRSPNLILAPGQALNPCPSPAVGIPQPSGYHGHGVSGVVGDDRNVFAIYVSYYVKVKLTLSSMGGELALKLPFVLVHIEDPKVEHKVEKLALDDVPVGKKNGNKTKSLNTTTSAEVVRKDGNSRLSAHAQQLDRIESVDDEVRVPIPDSPTGTTTYPSGSSTKRKLVRSETLAKDLSEEIEEQSDVEVSKPLLRNATDSVTSEGVELEQVHVVQIHSQVTGEKGVEAGEHKPRDTEIEHIDSEKPKLESVAHKKSVSQDELTHAEAVIELAAAEAVQSLKESPDVGGVSNPQQMPNV